MSNNETPLVRHVEGIRKLVSAITSWASDRNLIKGGTVGAQFLKLVEEVGEFSLEVDQLDHSSILNELGDVFVVQIIMHAQLGKDYTEGLLCVANDYQGPDYNPLYPYPDESDYVILLGRVAAGIAKRNVDAFLHGSHSLSNVVLADAMDAIDAEFYPNLQTGEGFVETALHLAYTKIKDRKGRMENGVFIKEND